jgi:hypothetical protein
MKLQMKTSINSTASKFGNIAKIGALTAGALVALSALSAKAQTIEHRYSFINNANDSVGTANGTLVGTGATINNGLSLPGTGTSGSPSGYVSLPNGIVKGDTSVTVDCWVTQAAAREWAEIWSFGVSGGSVNFGLIPDSSSGNMRVAFTPSGGEVDINSPGLASGTEYYICVTYNNATTNAVLYTNGVIDAGSGNPGTTSFSGTNYSPGGFGGINGTTDDGLGIDPFGGDDQFRGTIYELRIWSGVVSPLYLTATTLAGPSVVINNLTPTAVNIGLTTTNMVGSGTQQASVSVNLSQMGTTNVPATSSATSWTSGNTSILTVNSNGLITAVNGGTTYVTAKVNGVTGTSANITVALTSPVITQPPTPLSENIGDTAVFTVSAVGGDLDYQWYFGASPINGATGSTLTLSNISLASQGNYSVEVYNSLGTNYSAAVALTDAPSLVHRFSFSSLNDEVGTATATLVGGAYQDGAGNVQLPNEGGTSANADQTYVLLSPGILTNSPSMSIEVWATDTGSEQWAELVSIGGTTDPAETDLQGQTNYISIIPHSGNGNQDMLAAFKSTINNEEDVDGPNNTPLPVNTPEYVVLTYDAQKTTATLYLNGVQVAINTNINITPSSLGNTYDNFLGSDQYGGDPNFVGSIGEFRTWTGPVSTLYQALSLSAGSTVVVTNTTASAIALTVTNTTMLAGTTQQAVLMGTFPQVTSPVPGSLVSWTSSNTNIIGINSSGVVAAVGPGGSSATVSATFEGLTVTSSPITNAVVKPTISQGPANQSVYTGQAATFSVEAAGGDLTYQWYLGASPIEGATDASLVLADIPLSANGGIYSVTVENTAGSTNASATLSVSEPSLNHRFSFTGTGGAGTVVNDSIGSATATLEGNSYLSNGAVQLPDTDTTSSSANASYVLLSDGLLVGDNSATIEVWVTDLGGREWAEVYSFGGSTSFYDNAENGTNYLALIPDATASLYLRSDFRIGDSPTASVSAVNPLLLGVEWHVALIYDNSTATGSIYLNGNLVAQNTNMTANGPASPAGLGDTFDNYLGRDQFGGDPIFQGSINELRIYNGPLTPTDVVNDYLAGPTTATSPGSPNKVTAGISISGGNVTITWPVGTLLQAPTVLGPWTTNSAAVSPYTVPADGGTEFYRIQVYP